MTFLLKCENEALEMAEVLNLNILEVLLENKFIEAEIK